MKASLKPRTMQNYKFFFVRFLVHAMNQKVAFSDLSVGDVFLFLDTYKKPNTPFSTINGVACGVKWFLRRSPDHRHIANDPGWKDYMNGLFKSCAPPRARVAAWDPQRILDVIEPLPKPSGFVESAREALILVLLACGLRISDVEKMMAGPLMGDFCLEVSLSAPRKADYIGRRSSTVMVPYMPQLPRLCPARALRRYLRLTHDIRAPGETALFIASTGKRAARQTLQSWVKHWFKKAGICAAPGSTRSASTSAAAFSGIGVDEIMRAAGWRSASVFRRHYQRPVYSAPVLYQNILPSRSDAV
jgi:integrase